MLIIAHRGASYAAPENTLAAFRLAWAEGADGIEGDFQLSRDGVLVCCHDATTARTAGVDRRVDAQTLAELQQLDMGVWKGERYRGERMPTLAQVLAELPAGKRMLIELKSGPEAVPELLRVVTASRVPLDRLALICFSPEAVAAVKAGLPELTAYLLVGLWQEQDSGTWRPTQDELLANLATCRADGADLSYRPVLDASWTAALAARGLSLHVWTVDDAAAAHRCRALGVTTLTTNRPGPLRAELAVLSAAPVPPTGPDRA
jgi:glycerophosphoryl diester phosphodiesterase